MPIPIDTKLYEKVKKQADQVYKKHSAYKSGYIVQQYLKNNGRYIDDGSKPTLKRWYAEQWMDIGNKDYPVYRPTKIISKKYTPLTVDEIDKNDLKKQISLKQKIKGFKNLPPFKKK
jgi:hypothetical protein